MCIRDSAYTGRDKIVKFEGCYHGHADPFLVQAGSGVATLGLPDSPGVPKAATNTTLCAPYNDLEAVKKIFEENKGEIAGVILEPVVGNSGFIVPDKEFLEGLREITKAEGALLTFDEVMTGFRIAKGCAQEYWGVTPDLTTMGKVIGGGLPVGAYGGRRDVMDVVAPAGPMYQAGTLSGNPLAMTAGIETLKILGEPGSYEHLDKIIKFEGCYHGHADPFLVQAGSGVATLGLPDSPGVPKAATNTTLCAPYNDLEAVKKIFEENKGEIAGVILEPVVGNSGFIVPDKEFLEGLRELTTAEGALLTLSLIHI